MTHSGPSLMTSLGPSLITSLITLYYGDLAIYWSWPHYTGPGYTLPYGTLLTTLGTPLHHGPAGTSTYDEGCGTAGVSPVRLRLEPFTQQH